MDENKRPDIRKIENESLIEAIVNLKKDPQNKQNEIAFVAELRKAVLISPAIIEVKDENGEFKRLEADKADPKNTKINFMMLSQKDGKTFLPAFTKLEELTKFREDEKLQTIVTNFDQYLSIICSDEKGPDGFVIDPFGENLIMPRELLMALFNASRKMNDEHKDQFMLGDAKEYPQDLIDSLKDFFEENGTVENAYIRMMRKGNEISFLIVVDYDNCEEKDEAVRKELFDAIAEHAKDFRKGLGISVASIADDFGKQAVENKFPFYTR